MNQLSTWIAQCNAAHNSKYDYALWTLETIAWHKKVPITCPIHGRFEQRLGSHIKGSGCKECANHDRKLANTKSITSYIADATAVHGHKYDYSLIPDGTPNHVSVSIICADHGTFHTTLNQHIQSAIGCPLCKRLATQAQELINYGVPHQKQRSLGKYVIEQLGDIEWIVDQNRNLGKSLATIASELGCSTTIICRRLQAAEQKVRMITGVSKGEREIRNVIKSLDIEAEYSDRTIIAPKELDIVIESHKLAIEYCGLYWHSNTFKDNGYHLNKLKAANTAGYRLVTIYEDEWKASPSIVTEKLKQILGKSDRPTIFGRKCSVVELNRNQKNEFFDVNHIQGSGPGSLTYGLTYDGQVVAAMTFIKKVSDRWDLNRFATSHNIPGGFSKLLKHFERNNVWQEIVSFADRRWSEGGVYTKNGFALDSTSPPDYSYIVNNKTVHKFNFRHKNLSKILGDDYDPNLSELENTARAGYTRIYNCGLLRYIKTRV